MKAGDLGPSNLDQVGLDSQVVARPGGTRLGAVGDDLCQRAGDLRPQLLRDDAFLDEHDHRRLVLFVEPVEAVVGGGGTPIGRLRVHDGAQDIMPAEHAATRARAGLQCGTRLLLKALSMDLSFIAFRSSSDAGPDSPSSGS